MPPRRVARGCPTRRSVEEPEFPNAPEVEPEGEVNKSEFHESIRTLS